MTVSSTCIRPVPLQLTWMMHDDDDGEGRAADDGWRDNGDDGDFFFSACTQRSVC